MLLRMTRFFCFMFCMYDGAYMALLRPIASNWPVTWSNFLFRPERETERAGGVGDSPQTTTNALKFVAPFGCAIHIVEHLLNYKSNNTQYIVPMGM